MASLLDRIHRFLKQWFRRHYTEIVDPRFVENYQTGEMESAVDVEQVLVAADQIHSDVSALILEYQKQISLKHNLQQSLEEKIRGDAYEDGEKDAILRAIFLIREELKEDKSTLAVLQKRHVLNGRIAQRLKVKASTETPVSYAEKVDEIMVDVDLALDEFEGVMQSVASDIDSLGEHEDVVDLEGLEREIKSEEEHAEEEWREVERELLQRGERDKRLPGEIHDDGSEEAGVEDEHREGDKEYA